MVVDLEDPVITDEAAAVAATAVDIKDRAEVAAVVVSRADNFVRDDNIRRTTRLPLLSVPMNNLKTPAINRPRCWSIFLNRLLVNKYNRLRLLCS